MSESILVEGESGTGKTTAMRNMNPDETVYINVSGKPMPLPAWKKKWNPDEKISEGGNYAEADKAKQICGIMQMVSKKRDDITNIVIDDFQYMSAFEFFSRVDEKGWDKFNEIGRNIFDVFNTSRNLRDDLKVIIMTHTQEVGGEFDKKLRMKTIGN